MSKKTVVILQDTNDSADKIKKALEENGNFEVVGCTTDSTVAIEKVKALSPDILITEIILVGYDGVSVINKLSAIKPNLKIIVLSAISRDEIVNETMNAGATYFMAKPYNAQTLCDRILDLCAQKPVVRYVETRKSLDEKISKIFINVGIPPHIKGYSFLREGVKMAVNEPSIINNITKQLYPRIGEKYQTSASKVERAIRHAIEVAWNRGRIENINNILGVRAYVGQEKPTNGEFIALVADKMLLEES
ncbi:MAG: sporulation transcription factor Spo0A [Clostridia bacterium]|nr:sporulation transcription factor Spo0A [Clostridia bacterium]